MRLVLASDEKDFQEIFKLYHNAFPDNEKMATDFLMQMHVRIIDR